MTIKLIQNRIKIAFIAIMSLLLVSSAFIFAGPLMAKAEEESEAYYLYEDSKTSGSWYTGNNGAPKSDTSNRLYGKAGVILPYHKITGDGQPVKDVDRINNHSEDSDVNYVEYPSWVDAVTADIRSVNDTPHGYWNYREENYVGNGTPEGSALLSIDPTKWNKKDVYQITTADINYTVYVNDSDWHRVTLYTGFTRLKDPGAANFSYFKILDHDRNVLAMVEASSYGLGKYYSFAVKGSFILQVMVKPGTYDTSCNGIFFDDDYENPSIAKSNLSAAINKPPKEVKLTWANMGASSTAVYRRASTENYFSRIALLESGNSYTDKDTKVSTTYYYMIGAGVDRAGRPASSGVMDFTIPDTGNIEEVRTADYRRTSIEFEFSDYSLDSKKDTAHFNLTLKKDVQYNAAGKITDAGVPYEGITVHYTLDGQYVYDTTANPKLANMKTELGSSVTDSDGKTSFSYQAPFAGEYTITAYIDIQPDPYDPEDGYDSCSATVPLSIKIVSEVTEPILFSISDAIKPGDSLTIFGNFLIPGPSMLVAYAPHDGIVPGVFDEANPPEEVKYLFQNDLTVADDHYNTGLMMLFPSSAEPGQYNFWVKNEYGWSKGITMNAVRPLYIDQEASYEGLPIEIVGRNFFMEEYGVEGANPYEDIVVRLKRTGDINGNDDGSYDVYNTGILEGIRYSAEESFTGVEIEESNPYRLTFITPLVNYGTYEIYVASDGVDFRALARPQKLIIYEKKTLSYNTSELGREVFGNDTEAHIGNDPLDLEVYWAQNLKYDNIAKAVPQAPFSFFEYATVDDAIAAVQARTNLIKTQINNLSSAGGGVMYFPNGTYYLCQLVLPSNVFLVGESTEGTILRYAGKDSMFIRGSGASNVGIARLTLTIDPVVTVPDRIVNIEDSTTGIPNASKKIIHNVFMTDVSIIFPQPARGEKGWFDNSLRGISVYNGLKNFVFQNMKTVTNYTPLYGGFYMYSKIRNCDMNMNGDVAGPGHKYAFIENTSLVAANEGHGWSARTDCYFANNYVADIGYKENNDNKGEVIMFEPPNAYFTRGVMLDADERTFTVANQSVSTTVKAGGITENTPMAYNYFAVVIVNGKGTGQMRYFEPKTILNNEGEDYLNRYELCDNESDWDVIPDETSEYTIFLPMEGQTVYRMKGENCAKALYLYSQIWDAVVVENELNNTEGIGLTSAIGSGRLNTNRGVRIERNTVTGVSGATGKGGIYVSGGRGSNAPVLMTGMVSIRDNTVLNTVSEFTKQSGSELPGRRGIIINTNNTANSAVSGDLRYIIIEGNTVENSEYGVYCDNNVLGIVVRNNTFNNIQKADYVTYFGPSKIVISSKLEFYINNALDIALSNEYTINEELPKLSDAADGKKFWGWSITPEYTQGTSPILTASGANFDLYALFGYKITLMYNYLNSGGADRGVYNVVAAIDGYAITQSLGNPYRPSYRFAGWYTDPECTLEFDTWTVITGHITLYAKWATGEEETDNGKTPPSSNKKGCASCSTIGTDTISGIGGGLAIIALMLIIAPVALKRRKPKLL